LSNVKFIYHISDNYNEGGITLYKNILAIVITISFILSALIPNILGDNSDVLIDPPAIQFKWIDDDGPLSSNDNDIT